MLIHNHRPDGENHGALIRRLLAQSDAVDLMVSYVKSAGAGLLRDALAKTKLRLLCARDMDITDPSALVALAETGANIKIYESSRGNFHPKMWLFYAKGKAYACVIGSANMSAGALLHNVEVGAFFDGGHPDMLKQARGAFDYFWGREEAHIAEAAYLQEWMRYKESRQRAANEIRKLQASLPRQESETLKKYVESWIDIGVDAKTSGGAVRGNLWRGWYVIPDQGYIDNNCINCLHRICRIIADADTVDISTRSTSPVLAQILNIVRERLQGIKKKMTPRKLFIRREKNYLEKFGFAEHPPRATGKPNRELLRLTDAGKRFATENKQAGQKRIYTESMDSYIYNGLALLPSIKSALGATGHLTNEEFGLFVNHAYTAGDLDLAISLTLQYRALPEDGKAQFREWYSDLFARQLESAGGKNVRGNYDKKIKHTLSALGWCEGLRYDKGVIKTA